MAIKRDCEMGLLQTKICSEIGKFNGAPIELVSYASVELMGYSFL